MPQVQILDCIKVVRNNSHLIFFLSSAIGKATLLACSTIISASTVQKSSRYLIAMAIISIISVPRVRPTSAGKRNGTGASPQRVGISEINFCVHLLVNTFLAIFRNEITTILTPSTSEVGEWGRWGWSRFSF